jgi:hypothetical protein
MHMRGYLLLYTAILTSGAGAQDSAEFFESKVRPVLAANCHSCHTQAAMGGLRLDSRDAAMKGGKSGAVIVSGKPDDSILMQAVRRTHAKLKMPPTAPLKPDEVAALERWIKDGVVWPEAVAPRAAHKSFWSFQPLQPVTAPKVKNTGWVKTSVDAFVLSKLEAKRLKPNPAVDKVTLLRRLTLDLTGLPPTPEEVDQFLSDKSPKALATVVDRLLDSPHYGERWGRYWLDLARYSDGLLAAGVDDPLPNAWRGTG